MSKRIFFIEGFEAKKVGRQLVYLYPFPRERFGAISIILPQWEPQLRTGKIGFSRGELSVGSSMSYHTTTNRSRRFGRAIVAAADYLDTMREFVRTGGR